MIRAAMEKGQEVAVHLQADIKEKTGLKTGNVWGVLPGASDENILIMAHTDAFFEGALDNASGIAMMLEIARHYAAIPQSQRPRTITFLTTPDHHHGSVGVKWVHDHMDDFFAKTAVIVNCEHPSQTLTYLLSAGIMTSNAVSARRWYVGGSDALKKLVTATFKEFGVSVYTVHVAGAAAGRGAFAAVRQGPKLPHHRPRHLPHDAGHTAARPRLGHGGGHARVPQGYRRRQQDEPRAAAIWRRLISSADFRPGLLRFARNDALH
jgi:hypothetical protein